MSLFAKLFRYSKFVELGSVNGQKIVGRVVHRVNDDLYIDFGCKFNAVCKRPKKDSEKYVIGSNVLIRIFDTELSERFLGSKNDLTLLEADAIIIGLYSPKNIAGKTYRGTNTYSEKGVFKQKTVAENL